MSYDYGMILLYFMSKDLLNSTPWHQWSYREVQLQGSLGWGSTVYSTCHSVGRSCNGNSNLLLHKLVQQMSSIFIIINFIIFYELFYCFYILFDILKYVECWSISRSIHNGPRVLVSATPHFIILNTYLFYYYFI